VIARVVLVVLAAVAVVVAADALRADHRCAQVRADAFRVSPHALAALADEAAERCGDPRDVAAVAVTAYGRGSRSVGVQLARRMTAANPEDNVGWVVLWRISGDRAALVRAHQLDPHGTPRP
jgi:hypothetical protein